MEIQIRNTNTIRSAFEFGRNDRAYPKKSMVEPLALIKWVSTSSSVIQASSH